MYVVQIVLQQLSLTVFVTTHLLGVCSSEKVKISFPRFFLNFPPQKHFAYFLLLLYLLRAFNDDDDTRGRTPTALLKNVENNFKVI